MAAVFDGRTSRNASFMPAAAARLADTQVEDVRLARADTHHAVGRDLSPERHHAAGVPDPQAVTEDPLAPGKLVGGTLDRDDLVNISVPHRADRLGGAAEQLRGGGHRSRSPARAVDTGCGQT